MKEFEIWIEGYSVTGNSSPASCIGKAMGEDFNDACRNFRYREDMKNPYGDNYFHRKGDPLNLDKSDTEPDGLRKSRVGTYSIWACALFDNESDARKSFG